jgi:hypothetical protein
MSDVETADLDLDGDLDLLITNGDTLDDGFPWKPYHGVSWLVNDGAGNFELRRIGILYGAHGARAVDLDRDGDLDVVASGFLPQVEPPLPQGGPRIESLVWFEHTNQGFVPWALEDGTSSLASTPPGTHGVARPAPPSSSGSTAARRIRPETRGHLVDPDRARVPTCP